MKNKSAMFECSKKLPDKDGSYIVLTNGKYLFIERFVVDLGFINDRKYHGGITHWMERPTL